MSEDDSDETHLESYRGCLEEAKIKFDNGAIKLCPRGYCTAKHIFEVYPSAYANGHAVQICKGNKPCYEDLIQEDGQYLKNLELRETGRIYSDLNRWYQEEWVNLCKKDPGGPGGFAVCGSGKGINNLDDYPYCRAYHKLGQTKVISVEELEHNLSVEEFEELIEEMCFNKQSLVQGVDGKPTRINLPDDIKDKIKSTRKKKGGGCIKIPISVKNQAEISLNLKDLGFKGGTETGWNRAEQLSNDKCIDLESLADMRTWFARHGPDAANGGTSYPGYLKWKSDDSPMDSGFNNYRGAVSWLLWGGDPAYTWLKTPKIRQLLEDNFPKRKKSTKTSNLKF